MFFGKQNKRTHFLAADTKVLTRHGYRPIKKLRTADEVASIEDDKIVFRNILKISKSGKLDMYQFTRTDGTIYKCTTNYKFLTTEGMKEADEIQSRRLELYSIPIRESTFDISTYKETNRLEVIASSKNYKLLNVENAVSFLVGLISIALRSNYVSKDDKIYFEFHRREEAEYAYFAASLAGISCRVYRFRYIFVVLMARNELNKIIKIQATHNLGLEVLIREYSGKGYSFEFELSDVSTQEGFDLDVEGTHNYIIEGCQVVNCG
jgi:hypothetical protein